MVMRIDGDASRFKDIVRGKIRQNLRKYITHGEMIGRKGDGIVSIPLPQLDVPRFRFGKNGQGGVGQGDGDVGDTIGQDGDTDGSGQAGSEPGAHILEVELTIDELAKMLADELELPRIQPKGERNLRREKSRYTTIRRVGPESLRHSKRTFIEALKREIAGGGYDRSNPRVIPYREDKRYRAGDPVLVPEANALILYMMDVSGSMTDEQKAIVRTEAFWIDTWIKTNYRSVHRKYIIHDAAAKEVDEQTFYRTRESGGTRISSAYKVALEILERSYNPNDWNIYVFQFSDGDNWGEDNQLAVHLLKTKLLPICNLYCYGQVESPYGSGDFLRTLHTAFGKEHETLVVSEIENRDAIFDSIKTFLGRGK